MLFLVVAFASLASAQSALPGPKQECECSIVGHCSASQSCPDGYIAVCTCSATGCSSSCTKIDGVMELSEPTLEKMLLGESAANFGKVLSKAFKKIVTFKPFDPNLKFEFNAENTARSTHWDLLDYLAKNGDLKINGHDLDFWKGVRQNLMSGGGFKMCAGPVAARLIVDELSFLTGTRYSIISGDQNTKVTGPFEGSTISEITEKIGRQANVVIAEKQN